MKKLNDIEPKEVFYYFEEICSIPHGSKNTTKICNYLMDFAKKNNLKALSDEAENVIIYKPASIGYEHHEPLILQAHTDMVCQKTPDYEIDFLTDGLDIFSDGKYIKANSTTLGADNGIAVAMILAILKNDTLIHPPLEAVFTTDEEIGMIGAGKLDVSKLKGKRMINIDSEESDSITVSCAGGSDFKLSIPYNTQKGTGTSIILEIKNLKGGHSGVEIDKGRINSNILAARILNHIGKYVDFNIISIDGGNKSNAIAPLTKVNLLIEDVVAFSKIINKYSKALKSELKMREENLEITFEINGEGEFDIIENSISKKLIYMLLSLPNGVIDMSAEIENLVETSLNIGILKTKKDKIYMQYALRSNKMSSLDFLEEKLLMCADYNDCEFEISGRYNPWEYMKNSSLRDLYIDEFKNEFGFSPTVSAIHAGLECAVFSEKIPGLDCIAIGPDIFGAHTVEEKLDIASTNSIFDLLCKLIRKC